MYDKHAMLVELTIRQWTARKHDKKVSGEVDQTHGAQNAGRYSKYLIPKTALADIATRASAMREYHYRRTLPWGQNGQRILPAAIFLDYRKTILELKALFDRRVDMFVNDYPRLVHEARVTLGTLYDPSEYPAASDIKGHFGVDLEIFQVPTSGDFRVEVADTVRNELQAESEAAIQQRLGSATKACYVRVREVLERMKNQCTVERSRITEALVEDVRDLTQVMDDLNITKDPELSRITREIRDGLVFQVDDLRKSPTLRKEANDRASAILESLPWS